MSNKLYIIAILLFGNWLSLKAQSSKDPFLFAYFKGNGEDGLHYAYSEDAYHWKALKNDQSFLTPTVSKDKLMRDPCIIRGAEGLFHMVWTVSWKDKGIGYASSKDLINWSEQQFIPVMAKEEGARNTWAPEITYDPENKTYMIYWATTITGKFSETASKADDGYNHRMYYITTKDFKTFSDTKLLYDPGFNVIDASIVKDKGRYVMFLKDETREPAKKNLRIAFSDRLTGPYSAAGDPITGKYWAEGPTVIKRNDDWLVYFDKYTSHQYGAIHSTDLKNWKDVSDQISLPKGLRHGTILQIKQKELKKLLAQSTNNTDELRDQDTRKSKISGNPIIKDKYTADPAAFVYGDSVYLYTGHDEAPKGKEFYEMHEWLCYSSADMLNWKEHKVPLRAKDFSWAKGDSWASQVTERDGKFYWYVSITHNSIPGKAIGVAVADNPRGPFKDALGKALVTNDMTTDTKISWDDIDPSVIVDQDGQAYLFWGNTRCYYAKLKKNMIEFDGPIQMVSVPEFTEAPWIHYRKGWYYLSYATQFPEKIAYAMSRNINGPWQYKGILNEIAGNSNTNHQAIIDFKGKSYFIYHNGGLNTDGGSYRRSVCIDYLHYNNDGSMKRVIMTTEGVEKTR